MDSAGMMKMATGEGSPSGRVPGRAPERFLEATEACGGGTPDLSYVLEVLGYIGIYRRKRYVGGATRAPRGRGARPGGWVRPHPRGQPGTLLVHLRYSVGFFWSKNDLREISGQLDSV